MDLSISDKTFENYPLWMIAISDTVSFGIYITGTYIMFRLGAILGWLYLFFCLLNEFRIMRMSCRFCYYYGKLCGPGRGKLASLLFKKGDPKVFLEKQISWKDLIPDLLVSLIPFIIGIYVLITAFTWLTLIFVLIILLLTTFGNGYVRGNIVCKYCKQRELGCPAEKLFNK